MRRVLWAFIVAIAVLDMAFAVRYAEWMQEWELNPAMRLVAAHFGIYAACKIRVATILLACFACLKCKSRVGDWGTATAFLTHLALAWCYASALWK